ncbi:MAG TPA: extracellular solute-binding protein [Bordetella sp.]
MKFPRYAAFALALSAGQAAHAADLTVTAFGGSWEQAYRKCFVQPFEKRTGKTVDVILGSPTQWINQISANPSKPPIDVMVGAVDSGMIARQRGLVDELTEKNVPNITQINPTLLNYGAGYGFPITFGDLGLMYNTDTVKAPPKTWKEFVDGTIAGKWHAAIPGIAYVATPQGLIAMLAKVYGGDLDNVQPALDQIKRMRDSGNVTFYNDPNTPLASLRQGDIDIAMYFDGRAWAEHDAGAPMIGYLNPEPGAVAFPNLVQKVKNGSPLGWDFVNDLAGAEGQACFANAMLYAASNKNVKYDPKVEPRVAVAEKSVWFPSDKIVANTPKWIEMWNKQIGR